MRELIVTQFIKLVGDHFLLCFFVQILIALRFWRLSMGISISFGAYSLGAVQLQSSTGEQHIVEFFNWSRCSVIIWTFWTVGVTRACMITWNSLNSFFLPLKFMAQPILSLGKFFASKNCFMRIRNSLHSIIVQIRRVIWFQCLWNAH